MGHIKDKLIEAVFSNRNFKTIEIKTSQICFEERVKLKCFHDFFA